MSKMVSTFQVTREFKKWLRDPSHKQELMDVLKEELAGCDEKEIKKAYKRFGLEYKQE